MPHLAYFLEHAVRCRRLALAITETDPAVKTLLALAEEFEAKAVSLTDAAGVTFETGAGISLAEVVTGPLALAGVRRPG